MHGLRSVFLSFVVVFCLFFNGNKQLFENQACIVGLEQSDARVCSCNGFCEQDPLHVSNGSCSASNNMGYGYHKFTASSAKPNLIKSWSAAFYSFILYWELWELWVAWSPFSSPVCQRGWLMTCSALKGYWLSAGTDGCEEGWTERQSLPITGERPCLMLHLIMS